MIYPKLGAAILSLALCACAGDDEADGTTGDSAAAVETDDREPTPPGEAPGDPDDRRPFSEIAPDETVHFTGTEPFWGGEVTDSTLTYSTPENIEGTKITVKPFAGRGGMSYSGQFEGAAFDMMVTPGQCSDGMSDRTYPYTVTLSVQGEERRGCGWTDDKPRSVPPGYEP